MPKYGVHGFLLQGSWNNQIAPRVIAEVAELGFDLIQIPDVTPVHEVVIRVGEGRVVGDWQLRRSLRSIVTAGFALPHSV